MTDLLPVVGLGSALAAGLVVGALGTDTGDRALIPTYHQEHQQSQ